MNDEEDKLLSSILHNRRKNISLVSMSIQFLLPMVTILGEEPAGSLLCGFAFAFIRHAKFLHSILTHILRADFLEFLFHCCSDSSQVQGATYAEGI